MDSLTDVLYSPGKFAYDRVEITEETLDKECFICKDAFHPFGEDGSGCHAIRLKPCGHVVGEECFRGWLEHSGNDICSLCQTKLQSAEFERGGLLLRALTIVAQTHWYGSHEESIIVRASGRELFLRQRCVSRVITRSEAVELLDYLVGRELTKLVMLHLILACLYVAAGVLGCLLFMVADWGAEVLFRDLLCVPVWLFPEGTRLIPGSALTLLSLAAPVSSVLLVLNSLAFILVSFGLITVGVLRSRGNNNL